MSQELDASRARASFAELSKRAAYGGEFTYITHHGRRTVAVVPASAAELLEEIEDVIDLREVEAILDRIAAGKEDLIPWVPGGISTESRTA